MNTIKRINLVGNTVDEIAIFDSETTRYFKERNLDVQKSILKICSLVPTKIFEIAADDAYMQILHYARVGYRLEDIDYAPLVVAASDSRKATAMWVAKTVAGDYWKWAMCGLSLPQIAGKIAINKYMAYLGLLSSASKRFSEAFEVEIDVNRIAVVEDGYVEVTGIVDVVHEDGTVEKDVERTVRINAFDGMGLIRATLTDGESVTIRGPWIKAFVQATNWVDLVDFGFKSVGSAKIKTLYGERDLKDLDIILTRSCFKASKLYETWEQYANAFVAYGHHISVCVREHAPKLKGMPYQQGQTLQGTDEDVEHFAQHSLATVSKYEDKKEATNLLNGWHKACAKMYPALMKESHTARTMQEKYYGKKYKMLAGRIPELGANAFIAADMKAFAEHLFGLKIVGSLKAGECALLLEEKGMADVTRSPHLDNAHVLLMNTKKMPFVPAKSPTFFLNVWDLTTIRLRCDYDGDHVWYSQNPELLDLVVRTYAELHNNPVDWEAPESPKGIVNKATIAEFVANLLKASEIGLYADALTKMWANGYDREVCDWLTYAGNVLIDAAKHGNIKIEKPEAVKAVDQLSLPEFCRYAKADKEHPCDSPYWTEPRETKKGMLPPRTQYSGSFLDKYSRRCKELIPDTLVVRGLEDEIFDPTMMLIKPDRKIGRLKGLSCKSRYYNHETGAYDDGGLFQQIAFRHAAEWKTIMENKGFAKMDHKEWEEAKAKEAQAEMIKWAREKYLDDARMQAVADESILEAIYDIVTRNVFGTTKVSEGYDTAVKSAYWRIFGELAFNTLRENLGEEALVADVTIDFDDDDDDED